MPVGTNAPSDRRLDTPGPLSKGLGQLTFRHARPRFHVSGDQTANSALAGSAGKHSGDDVYIGVPCQACGRLHFLNPESGKLLGEKKPPEKN